MCPEDVFGTEAQSQASFQAQSHEEGSYESDENVEESDEISKESDEISKKERGQQKVVAEARALPLYLLFIFFILSWPMDLKPLFAG